ncbi:ATP-binding cassette domain-containing protein [Paenibacillaceae bacterium]|nr:ATP-binding cassette domain-containing protein [Paenibacillaceae bacterium]
MKFVKSLLHHFLEYKFLSSIFLLSILIEVAYAVAAPLSLKYLVDEAFTPKDFTVFIIILGILLSGGLLSILAGTGGDYTLGKLSGEVIRKLRTRLFVHVQQQSLPFFQRYRVGDLVTRFASDMSSIEGVIRFSSPLFLKEMLSILLGLTMLFLLEWKLALAMLLGSLLMFAGPRLLQNRAETANADYKASQERFSNTIDEMVKGHKTIKSLHQQSSFQERASKQIHSMFTFGLRLHMINALIERLPLTALLLLNGTLIGFGGYLIFNEEMTIGSFMAFFTLFMSVGQSASNIAFLIPNLIDSSISFRRIGEVLEQQPTVPEASEPVQLPPAISSIRMEQVTFGYDEQADQLHEVSLQIAAGSYVAFVGPSGSGKSTALQLLSRFYDPRQGAVLFDDINLRDVSDASLRRIATLVTQETFLFHATIRDNLLLDNAATGEADMIKAAQQANIHDIINRWPEGYDTWIHHEGGSLSGGERQRIAIARALLRNPELLLLDEVTAALDPAAEAEINTLIQQIRHHKTIVTVTHRLASVAHADKIYVFEHGRIIESGTHQQLMDRPGMYFDLWEKQHGFQLSEDGTHATVEAERLAKLPFFAGIEPALLEDMASVFTAETCKDEDVVVTEGERGNKFYIIVHGKFEIIKRIPGDEAQRVAVLQDGDHFGEIALLKDVPRTATVKAMGSAMLLSVRREAFLRITDRHPQILQALERTLLQRM